MLPSNTSFPQLSYLSTTCMHCAITGTSSPLSLPKIFLSKPNQWVLMYRTAGPHVCCHTDPKLPFPQIFPSKQLRATVNPLALLSTWIQLNYGEKDTMRFPNTRDIILTCAPDTFMGCSTQHITRNPFLLPGENSCIKQDIMQSIQLMLNS